jgi:hypothetical protein
VLVATDAIAALGVDGRRLRANIVVADIAGTGGAAAGGWSATSHQGLLMD